MLGVTSVLGGDAAFTTQSVLLVSYHSLVFLPCISTSLVLNGCGILSPLCIPSLWVHQGASGIITAGGFRMAKQRNTIDPDQVYAEAMRRLNSNLGVLEVLS